MALLVVLSGIAGFVLGTGRPSTALHQMPGGEVMLDAAMGMHNEMAGMMGGLVGKEGDALDKAFLEEMIVHHEGAVTMAQAVLENGKHPELQHMATAIIEAQTKEIAQMKAWQTAWYGK